MRRKLIVTSKPGRAYLPFADPASDGRGWEFDLADCTYQVISVQDDWKTKAVDEYVVQVALPDATRACYAYIDPTNGTLKIDDLVRVPFGFSDQLVLGTVIGYGREGYCGLLKAVRYRLVEDNLVEVPL